MNRLLKLQFSQQRKESLVWFSKALVGSTICGVAISEYVITDERVDSAKSFLATQAEKLGFDMKAYAFSTADHGLHPPHYPWEFQKFYKTFDHAAYYGSN